MYIHGTCYNNISYSTANDATIKLGSLDTTAVSGVFHFDDVDPGIYDLTIYSPFQNGEYFEQLCIKDFDTTMALTPVLDCYSLLTVNVEDANGATPSDATCDLWVNGEIIETIAISGGQGRASALNSIIAIKNKYCELGLTWITDNTADSTYRHVMCIIFDGTDRYSKNFYADNNAHVAMTSDGRTLEEAVEQFRLSVREQQTVDSIFITQPMPE